eukprot:evm.model.scf_1379.4 EVM.evm.TU.scf_1379.4   scf_1379:28935-34995(-)
MRSSVLWTVLAALLLIQLTISRGDVADAGAEAPVVDGVETPDNDADATPSGGEAPSPGAKPRSLRENAQKFEFQAEVTRLLDIIINSLYSNKDIFLRELISNASDALDKIRFLALTDKKVLGEGEQADLDIKLSVDKENRVLKIRDKGVGMTKEELINNLGTIAKSGTSAFLEKIQKNGELNLIGQFGVGFYSVFLVADYVEVITKHNDDKQYIWESRADGAFAISEDSEGEPLGRGTQINIHLKEDAQEYAEDTALKALIKKYSEFINFPIYMYTSTEEEVEEEEEEEEEGSGDDVEDEEEEDESAGGDETKPKKKIVWDWELQNESKAIWLRSPSDISDDEYKKFYDAIGKGRGEPLTWTHFKAEGDVEFRALLYVPDKAAFDFYDRYYDKEPKGVKLYVRRVFISDDNDDLLPRYLSFIIGVVDSDSLPINVSRETLQQHNALKIIRKKLVKKALAMLLKLAEAERKPEEDEDAEDEEKEKEEKDSKPGKYERKKVKEEFKVLTTWWKEQLGAGEVDHVKVSNRLATTPCVVVTSRYGWSANMERIMKAQSYQDPSRQMFMKGRKSLEINPRHPLIRELKAKVEADSEADDAKSVAHLLYGSALLESGFVPEDPKAFARRLHVMVKDKLGIETDLDDIPDAPEAEEEEEEEEEEGGEGGDDDDDLPPGFEWPSGSDFNIDDAIREMGGKPMGDMKDEL